MAADAHSFSSLYEQHLFSRIHPFNLNPNEIFNPPALAAFFFSSSQTSMTASQSHVKMEALASTRLIHSSAFACPVMEETHARKVRVRILHTYTWMTSRPRYVRGKLLWIFAHCCVCNHRGELVKIQSSDTSSKHFVANCAGGNNPDQDAASVTAICHDTISQRRISLQPSDSVSVCVTRLKGDRYWLKLLQA